MKLINDTDHITYHTREKIPKMHLLHFTMQASLSCGALLVFISSKSKTPKVKNHTMKDSIKFVTMPK